MKIPIYQVLIYILGFTVKYKINGVILYLAVKLMYIKMDKSDIFTAELILIFSLVIDISQYFHCRVWITSDVSIHLTSLNVPHFRNSNAYNSVIYEPKHKVWVFIFLVRTLGTMWYQNYLCFQNFLVFAFSPPAPANFYVFNSLDEIYLVFTSKK